MKAFVLAAALATTLASAGAASAQSAPSGIPGTFDPTTRVFVPQSAPTGTARIAAARGGMITMSMTINVMSAIPTSTPIQCGLSIVHFGSQGAYYTEAAQAPAVRSGNTATCTVKIPYLWALADTDSPIQPQITVTADRRQLMHALPSFALPPNGSPRSFTQSLRF